MDKMDIEKQTEKRKRNEKDEKKDYEFEKYVSSIKYDKICKKNNDGSFSIRLHNKVDKKTFNYIIEYIYTDEIDSFDEKYEIDSIKYKKNLNKIKNAAIIYELKRLEEICDKMLGNKVIVSESTFYKDLEWGYNNLGTTRIKYDPNKYINEELATVDDEGDISTSNIINPLEEKKIIFIFPEKYLEVEKNNPYIDLTDFEFKIPFYESINNKQKKYFIFRTHSDLLINFDFQFFDGLFSFIDTAKENTNKNTKITNITIPQFHIILKYLYTRNTMDIIPENAISMFTFAHCWGIKKMVLEIFKIMIKNIEELSSINKTEIDLFKFIMKTIIKDNIDLKEHLVYDEIDDEIIDPYDKLMYNVIKKIHFFNYDVYNDNDNEFIDMYRKYYKIYFK